MEPAKFSNRMTSEQLSTPFVSNKVKIRCEYNCDCFQVYKPNDIYYCENCNTYSDLYNSLISNGYATCCNHNFLEDFFVVSNEIVIPIFGN